MASNKTDLIIGGTIVSLCTIGGEQQQCQTQGELK